jgi:hypothetical protein
MAEDNLPLILYFQPGIGKYFSIVFFKITHNCGDDAPIAYYTAIKED